VKGGYAYQVSFFGGGSTSATHCNWNDVGLYGSENMNFYGWQDLNSPSGYGFCSNDLRGATYNFTDSSFDYNVSGAFYYINGIVRLNSGHVEQGNDAYFFNGPPSLALGMKLVIEGGVQFVTGSTALPAFIRVPGNNSSIIIGKGLDLYHPSGPVAQLVDWESVGSSNMLSVGDYVDSLANLGVAIPTVQSGANIQYLDYPLYSQYVPTDHYSTKASFGQATIGAKNGTGFIGATSNGCASPTEGTTLPHNGLFLGWNCDGSGGADFYNPFINNTAVPAFHFKTKLADGTWTDVLSIGRNGSLRGQSVNSVLGFQFNGTAGFTGTKTAGTCVFTIQGGIITNVTGC
jgi:hypothetical protein